LVFVSFAAIMTVAACGHKEKEGSAAGNVATPSSAQPGVVPNAPYNGAASADTTKAKHHSKLGGAAVGAVAGHAVGHGVVGAAVGAAVQHERNKHKK
jgi:hypothetical protein